jgi:REP element-mobilizing transposase RayT
LPRKPRVEEAGYHHIINRGVARANIFLRSEDYETFLEILEIAKERYEFTIHSFCLMSNHYHLLIETKHNNLSLIARQINSQYAQYFNKQYKRV